MKISATLLLCIAIPVVAQTTGGLRPDQFPATDLQAVSPLLNVPKEDASYAQPSQTIGAGDLIAIAVSDCPELTRNFRVGTDGMLSLPLIKTKILAAGKEPEEVESQITDALMREEVLVRPVVSASVVEYRSVPVSVMGAVKRPITFQAVGNVTLLDALARAEGLSLEAGSEILITHSRPGDGSTPLVVRVPVKELLEGGDPALNVRLYGGEEVRILPAGRVYVVGNVKKSGAYPIQEGNDTSILKIIAMSEGLLQFTSKQAYIYRRESGKNQRDEIPVELARIIDRKAPDVQLQANDILYIPDSKGRRLTTQTIERIISFGSATGTGVLVWR